MPFLRQKAGEYTFKDRARNRCQLRKSNLISVPAIWFGIVKTHGGVDVDYTMFLTQRQVKNMLPVLKKFAKTGEIV